jgi:hypothetical protein
MKGMTAFACISDIDLDLIEESAVLLEAPDPRGGVAAVRRPRTSALSRFFGSGWGVAVLCAFVSVSILCAIVWAGRLVPVGPPGPGTADTAPPRPTEPVTDPVTEPVTQHPAASEGLEFQSSGDGTCRVTDIGQCRDSRVVIPTHSPEGDRVTSVIKRAFEGCTGLVSVYVPDTVQSIGESAFEDCPSLTEVILPDGLVDIGPRAFEDCVSLTEITVPETVTHIGERAFMGCTSLASVILPGQMESIGDSVFQDCTSLAEILWPKGVASVPLCAFWNASSLERVTLSEDVTLIRGMAFEGCASLESLIVPLGLARVESRAFYGCRRLQHLHYGGTQTQWQRVEIVTEGNEALSHAAFHENSAGENLHVRHPDVTENGIVFVSNGDGTCKVKGADKTHAGRLTVPELSPYGDAVTTVATGAFKDFSGLTSVILPDTVTVIKGSAFQNCGSLVSVELPPEVTEFGRAMFDRCGELKSVVLPAGLTEIPAATFQTCVNLQRVVAQEGITSIGANAFNGCRSLHELTLPAGLESIGSAAFMNCCGLQTIYYGGRLAEWKAVEIHEYENAHLGHARIVCG